MYTIHLHPRVSGALCTQSIHLFSLSSLDCQSMEEDDDGPDPYTVLGLSRECTREEVRRAYRSLAAACHPDKHIGPGEVQERLRVEAARQFTRVQEAYEVLSDERKREVYDVYGHAGLRAGLAVGEETGGASRRLREELERLRVRREELRAHAKTVTRGNYTFSISATELVDPYEGVSRIPEMTGVAISQNVSTTLSDKDIGYIGGNAAQRRGVGGGSLVLGLRRQCSPVDTLELTSALGLKSILVVRSGRQLTRHAHGSLSMTLSTADAPGLSLGVTRQLGEHSSSGLTWTLGPQYGLTTSYTRQAIKDNIQAELRLGSSFGVAASWIHSITKRTHMRMHARAGNFGLDLEIGGGRRVAEQNMLALTAVCGIQGILLKLRFNRSGHKFVFPIQLTPVFDIKVLAISASLPPLFVLMLTRGIEPLHRFLEHWKAKTSSEENAEVILRSRQEAAAARKLLHNVAQRKRRAEEQRGGLVIIHACYGSFDGSDDGAHFESRDDTGDESFMNAQEDLIVDVTTAIQFLVDNGRLELNRGVTKAGLFGFCDPCPGVRKELRIVYEHGGKRSSVSAEDNEAVKLP